jgi:hypothetical protein
LAVYRLGHDKHTPSERFVVKVPFFKRLERKAVWLHKS